MVRRARRTSCARSASRSTVPLAGVRFRRTGAGHLRRRDEPAGGRRPDRHRRHPALDRAGRRVSARRRAAHADRARPAPRRVLDPGAAAALRRAQREVPRRTRQGALATSSAIGGRTLAGTGSRRCASRRASSCGGRRRMPARNTRMRCSQRSRRPSPRTSARRSVAPSHCCPGRTSTARPERGARPASPGRSSPTTPRRRRMPRRRSLGGRSSRRCRDDRRPREPASSARGRGPVARRERVAPGRGRKWPAHLTPEGLAALNGQLMLLTTVKRPEVVERVKSAREVGDLRENADYEAARNEQAFLEGRIRGPSGGCGRRSSSPEAVAPTASSCSARPCNSRSTVRPTSSSSSARPRPIRSPVASSVSPVGKALLGRRAGDQVVVKTPAAEMR